MTRLEFIKQTMIRSERDIVEMECPGYLIPGLPVFCSPGCACADVPLDEPSAPSEMTEHCKHCWNVEMPKNEEG